MLKIDDTKNRLKPTYASPEAHKWLKDAASKHSTTMVRVLDALIDTVENHEADVSEREALERAYALIEDLVGIIDSQLSPDFTISNRLNTRIDDAMKEINDRKVNKTEN